MKIYLTPHGGLYLQTIDFTEDELSSGFDPHDFSVRLAGEVVDIARKIEIVQELHDASEVFLEEQSQEFMKESLDGSDTK